MPRGGRAIGREPTEEELRELEEKLIDILGPSTLSSPPRPIRGLPIDIPEGSDHLIHPITGGREAPAG